MPRHADNSYSIKGSMWLIGILGLLFFSACGRTEKVNTVDGLNSLSYAYHYRNLDSVSCMARRALLLSEKYPSGKGEAYNNIAFVNIARMEYEQARMYLDSVELSTDNQVELLIADVQNMRLCQRESKNKAFYDYKERAVRRMERIAEEEASLPERIKMRLLYAKTEYAIVCSTYYYYVGLSQQSKEMLNMVESGGELQKDTAQYLNYLYQLGSGGIIKEQSRRVTLQKEFEYLMKCYVLAKQCGMVYWQANSLQAISEHLLDRNNGKQLMADNRASVDFLNEDNMPDSLLAGYLAQKSLNMFTVYGDVFQTAGAYRTLSFCYWALDDYASSLICLENALTVNPAINKSPAQVASIRECMSLVYSAMDDKNNSDINRNIYLDIQDETRQDRQLEARAGQLENTVFQLNVIIGAILSLIVIALLVFIFLRKSGKGRANEEYINNLLLPLKEWEEMNKQKIANLNEKYEAITERLMLGRMQLEEYKRRSLDNKAKVFLVNNVVPYIDRIINEVKKLKKGDEDDAVRQERFEYMTELTDKINDFNDVLTYWIKLQQGKLSLHVESFNLNDIFSILAKSEMSFRLKGINFNVEHTDVIVKADKILTLFMLNTLADNARKFTPKGGFVCVNAINKPDCVEISVEDSGVGLSDKELSDIFAHKIYNGHGFGLMNCKGIIDKYRKVSKIFNVCGLFAESEKGRGSRFYFRLPYGITRCLLTLLCVCLGQVFVNAETNDVSPYLKKAGAYADSAYYCNVNGSYIQTIAFVDSSIVYLNKHYKSIYPAGKTLMTMYDKGVDVPAEISWFHGNLKTNYEIILDIRNECAVAALALHDWNLYSYNNNVYTSLFKERSADKGLEKYCQTMQETSTNKVIALILLVILLAVIVLAFYFLYYRHVLMFRTCVDGIYRANKILLSDISDEDKLFQINDIDISKYPDVLKSVIVKIKDVLERSVEFDKSKQLEVELTEDELHRVMYEKEKLYVCNSVIDNSLSTLKHETMYYPSRIKQLVDDDAGKNIDAIGEVVDYYKKLYSILCRQVGRQIDSMSFECKPVSLKPVVGKDVCILGDKVLVLYFFNTLRKQCKFDNNDVFIQSADKRYVILNIQSSETDISEQQCRDLFNPSTRNIPFIICRQILREMAEQTNLHNCGMTITAGAHGRISLNVTFAQALKVL